VPFSANFDRGVHRTLTIDRVYSWVIYFSGGVTFGQTSELAITEQPQNGILAARNQTLCALSYSSVQIPNGFVQPPRELVEQIWNKRCIAIVGAGLSVGIGIPNWRGTLTAIIDWSERQGVHLSDIDDLKRLIVDEGSNILQIAQDLREQLGPSRYGDVLRHIFRPPGVKPTAAHELLVQIPFRGVITTNYDKLIEFAYGSNLPMVCTQTQTAELARIMRGEPFLLKAHGDIDNIETVVLGCRDYQDLLRNAAYQNTMLMLLSSATLLFVGFSLKDPDLQLVLDNVSSIYRHHTINHYALLPAQEVSPVSIRSFQRDYGITVVQYLATNRHPEVQRFLSALASAVRDVSVTAEPVTQYVLAKERADSELKQLEKARPNLTATEYLRRLAEIMRELRDKGQDNAWHVLASPFENSSAELENQERITLGLELAYLITVDAGAPRAVRILQPLISCSDELANEEPLKFAFWEAWARCLLECYDIDNTVIAMQRAFALASDEIQKQKIRALIAEMNFLSGRLEQAAVDVSESRC
jgi:SIR2-like domain